MGSFLAVPTGIEETPDTKQTGYLKEHPLLRIVENPVNKFCDDFAAKLDEEPTAKDATDRMVIASDTFDLDGYNIIKLIGQGAGAYVYEGLNIETNEKVAVKVYKRPGQALSEFKISELLNHPSILRVEKCVEIMRGMEKTFAAVMPLSAFGSLSNSNSPQLTVTLAVQLLDQIGGALAHMHAKGVVHRDVKPQNILVFDRMFCLSDFSVSVVLRSDDELLGDQIGTSVYMAPEIARNAYKPKPTDMWALGITVYCLLFGRLPFALESLGGQDLPAHIRVTDRVMPHPLTFPDCPVIPDELKSIISGLLDKVPDRRTTAEDLVANRWIRERISEWHSVTQMLKKIGG